MRKLARTWSDIAFSRPKVVEPKVAIDTTEERITAWHNNVETEINPADYNPHLIFNMDETMLAYGSRKFKVYHPRDVLPVRIEPNALESIRITLVLCISAAGRFLQPMAIMNRENVSEPLLDILDYYDWAYQSSGWMNKDIFARWAEVCLLRTVRGIRAELDLPNEPALLFVDGHSSRHNPDLMTFFLENNIHVVLLPPNATQILQPLDLGPIGAFKQKFTHSRRQTRQLALPERRLYILTSARKALNDAKYIDNIKEGFKKAGISPWDVSSPLASKHVFRRLPEQYSEPAPKRRRASIQRHGGVLTKDIYINEQKKLQEEKRAKKSQGGRKRARSLPSDEPLSK